MHHIGKTNIKLRALGMMVLRPTYNMLVYLSINFFSAIFAHS